MDPTVIARGDPVARGRPRARAGSARASAPGASTSAPGVSTRRRRGTRPFLLRTRSFRVTTRLQCKWRRRSCRRQLEPVDLRTQPSNSPPVRRRSARLARGAQPYAQRLLVLGWAALASALILGGIQWLFLPSFVRSALSPAVRTMGLPLLLS